MFVAYMVCHSGAINMIAGHELAHRRNLIHRICGDLVYAKFMYPHFIIQHVKSHHKKVATPEDPSSARKGESVFYFWWRAIPAGYVEVWELESQRLSKEGKSAFSLNNKLVLWYLMCVAYCVSL
jgi:alkane 1-monooxygenase